MPSRPARWLLAAALLAAPAAGAFGEPAEAPAARWSRIERRLSTAALARERALLDGLPVFGGERVELRSAGGAVLFRAGELPPARSGSFRVDGAGAIAAAARATGAPEDGWRAEPGWLPVAGVLRAAWRVERTAGAARGDFRVDVDASSGRVLRARDRRAFALGTAFGISPTEVAAGPCPAEGEIRSACAVAGPVPLVGLPPGATTLSGEHARVLGCDGADVFGAPAPPAACVPHAVTDPRGDFTAPPDPTGTSSADPFAEVNAYAHVDGAVRALAALSPGGPTLAPLQVYVNTGFRGAPLSNAFFIPSSWSLVIGQGEALDFAYDGTVLAHEVAHAFIEAAGGLDLTVDALGAGDEPLALGEGAADVFAASRFARPGLGSYVARGAGRLALRTLGGRATCRGSGARGLFEELESVDGLSGTSHVDGAIWSGLGWELREGLAVPGGCGPDCAAALQADALRLVAGTLGVRFQAAGEALVAAARARFPARPEIARYAACLVERHELATCEERTVPVHGEEPKAFEVNDLPVIHLRLEVPGPEGAITACIARGSTGRLLLRRDAPVEVALAQGGTFSFQLEREVAVTAPCGTAAPEVALPGPATWFASVVLDEPVSDVAQVRGVRGLSARPAAASPRACALEVPDAGAGGGGGCGCGGGGAGGEAFLLGGALLAWRGLRRRSGASRRAVEAPVPGRALTDNATQLRAVASRAVVVPAAWTCAGSSTSARRASAKAATAITASRAATSK